MVYEINSGLIPGGFFVNKIDGAKKGDDIQKLLDTCSEGIGCVVFKVNCDTSCILSTVSTLYHRSFPLHFISWLLTF
jgi:hypothetical protein